jgi:hypothetical protein
LPKRFADQGIDDETVLSHAMSMGRILLAQNHANSKSQSYPRQIPEMPRIHRRALFC